MKDKNMIFKFSMVFLSVVFLVFPGCGKKGPPVPPVIKGQKIAPPHDLKYSFEKNTIRLFWNHKTDIGTADVKPEAFKIFMAKKSFETCAGCPLVFTPAGSVAMPAMEYAASLEKGFKYYFRVQALGEDNMKSDFSKIIQFEYK